MMMQALESRQLFAVAPIDDVSPTLEPASEREVGMVVASNDLGPENVQKKHVATHKRGPTNYN